MAVQLITATKWLKNNIITIVRRYASFEVPEFKLHKLKQGPKTKVELDKDAALTMYCKMQSIRVMENNMANLYKARQIRGFCHLSNGQEACNVGTFSAMRSQDFIITSYRAHGWCFLMSGDDAYAVIAELLGKKGGISKGKGGSMHVYAKPFFGGQGIVGAQVPLGTGLAFGAKYLNNKGVSFTIYGDGAANQGQVYEAFNIAYLWKLPCIFICENNEYGMGTAAERSSASVAYYTRGDYIPGILVDGMNVLAVREASRFAIDYCLNGNGPILLELKTYRYFGHSMSDPGMSYRSRDEVQHVRQNRDPIKNFAAQITKSNLVTEQDLKTIDKVVKKKIDEISKKAVKENELPLEELTTDIYKLNLDGKIRGCTPFDLRPHKSTTNQSKS